MMRFFFLFVLLSVSLQLKSMVPLQKKSLVPCEKKPSKEDLFGLIQSRIKKQENLDAPIFDSVIKKVLKPPLIYSCQDEQYLPITKLLLENQANPNVQTQMFQLYRPLHYAVKNFAVETTKLLLQFKADPNLENSKKITPLHILCTYSFGVYDEEKSKKRIELISELLKAKANPNVRDSLGNTCLHKLISYSYFASLKPNKDYEKKRVRLMIQKKELIKKIINAGGSLEITNDEKKKPTEVICKDSKHYEDAIEDCIELSKYAYNQARYKLCIELYTKNSVFRRIPKDLIKIIVLYVYPYRKNESTP